MKKILFAVTNDISQDQRMMRICGSLSEAGYSVLLVGRKRKNSIPLVSNTYSQKRLYCFFEKGKLFYFEYNIRLFLYAIFQKVDIYGATDLDTILPLLFAAKLKGKKITYDAHEYFTEMEELMHRPLTKKVWKWVESFAVPEVDAAYTVSEGYKNLFEKHYPISFKIIRNASVLKPLNSVKKENYVLYQGAVNYGRGLFELIDAFAKVEYQLVICGEGDALDALKEKVNEMGLNNRIDFKGFVSPTELIHFTQKAKIGLTIFEKEGLSHVHSLANRFFDYFHAHVPQIAMNYPEYQKFNSQYEVALLIDDLNENTLINALKKLFTDDDLYKRLEENCQQAKQEFNWQQEEKTLIEIYSKLT